MPGQWRSSVAQVFVGGRITKIEQYWASTSLTFDLFEMIDEWDLWDAAFGGMASKTKSDWATYRHGPGVAQGLLMKVGKLTGISKPRAVPLGIELWTSIEQNVISKMQTLFDKSRLTINFNAGGWFGAQAGFDEYKTMWERLTTDASLNVNPDPKNPAHVRAKADRWALYGQFGKADTDMAASGMVLPHVKKQGGTTSAPTWNYATTKPGPTDATKPMAVDSQVFAALNYGRRKHGANTTYGKSVFELDHGYKKDAIFFAMDTFTPVSTGSGYKSKSDRSKLYQVSANAFGGAILLAIKSQYDEKPSATNLQHSTELAQDLFTAARLAADKPDNDTNHLFVEAHIFQKVDMTPTSVSGVRISKSEIATHANARTNITAFQGRTKLQIAYID